MTVGCGTHTAAVVDRDGATVAVLDPLTEVQWSRLLDDVSTAVARAACCAGDSSGLDQARTWRHQLVIWRNGLLVWQGPIIRLVWDIEGVTIHAADILAWLDRRVPHRDRQFTNTDLTEVASWLIRDGFAPDDPGYQLEILGPARVRGDREYETDVGQTGDHLRDLAATGIDYTAVGQRIVIMPEDWCDLVGALSDDDFPDGLTVEENGADLATRWVVWGRDGVKGTWGGRDSYYRLLERVDDQSSILDAQSARAAARSRWRASHPAPVYLDSARVTLSPDAGVDVPSLVPGWCLTVSSNATCRTLSQVMKIYQLLVTETAELETVAVTMVPTSAAGGGG